MTSMDRAKPFCIAKRDVWEAYKQVKVNRGAAGVDGQSIEDFDRGLSKNLYRIWNVLMENRHALVVDTWLTLATGTTKREAALAMVADRPGNHGPRVRVLG
jgi:hypothetical protein